MFPIPTPAPPAQPKAAVALADWIPSAAHTNQGPTPKVSVRMHEKCWAYHYRDSYVYVQVPRNGETVKGWVPMDRIRTGKARADPTPVSMPTPDIAPVVPRPAPTDDVLMRTLRLLWATIKRNKASLLRPEDNDSTWINSVLLGPHVDRYAEIMYRCIPPAAIAIMRNGQFNPRDVINALPTVSPQHRSLVARGTYLFGFLDINHSLARFVQGQARDAIYGGMTIDYQHRNHKHFLRLNNTPLDRRDPSHLYDVGKTAAVRKLVPFIVFPVDDTEISSIGLSVLVEAAELTTVCLFKSWLPFLIQPSGSTASLNYVADHENARSFSVMAAEVFSQTGWNPRPTLGLNWQTPAVTISAMHSEWVTWYDFGRSANVYTTKRVAAVASDGSCRIRWRSGTHQDIGLPIALARDSRLQTGDPVTIVVEIKQEGTRYLDHPVPWIRVPRPCRNNEFEKLRSMSVQIQWQHRQTQQWKASHVQWTDLIRQGGDEDTELAQFVHGMHLFATLTQTSYSQAPSWMMPLDTTVIRKLDVSHLAQRARIQPNPLTGLVCNWPANNTRQGNLQRLQAYVASRPNEVQADVYFGMRPAHVRWSNRTSCDLCFSLSKTGECDSHLHGRCDFCELYNRPCTWTKARSGRVNDLLVTHGLLQDLGFPTHLQAANARILPVARRAPNQVFEMDTASEPWTVTIAKQILGGAVPEDDEDE